MGEFRRALSFIEGLEELSSTRTEKFACGRAFFNDDFPVVWDINFARVERQPASWRTLADEVDELQGAARLSHRKIHLRDSDWAKELADASRGDGWTATALVFMVRRGEGEKASGGRAREVDYSEVRELRREMACRQPWATSDDDVRQVLDANRRWMSFVETDFFAVEDDGRFVAAADLYREQGLAQIEDVETLKEYRNRGYATDIVLEAARVAGETPQTTVFLIADENDWPAVLYHRLGFEPVGRRYSLLRNPEAARE